MYNQCPQGTPDCDSCSQQSECGGWEVAAVDDRTPPEWGLHKEDYSETMLANDIGLW